MENKTIIFIDQPTNLLLPCQQIPEDFTSCALSHILGFSSAFFFPIFASFGFVTNTLSFLTFIVWTCKPSRQQIYLGCLAVADTFMVITNGWLWMFPAKGLPYASNGKIWFFTLNHGEIICRLHRFLNCFSTCQSCNLLLLTVADRTFSVYFPMKAVKIGREKAWTMVTLVTAVSILIAIPFGTETGYYLQGKFTVCWLRYRSVFLNLLHLLFFNCGIFQAVSIFILNVMLVYRLKFRVDKVRCMESQRRPSKLKKSTLSSSAVVLLVLSTTFIAFSLVIVVGYSMAYSLQYKGSHRLLRYAWNIFDIGNILFMFQASVNWIIYMKMIPQFSKVQNSKLSSLKNLSPKNWISSLYKGDVSK